jgi:hypothetical protein
VSRGQPRDNGVEMDLGQAPSGVDDQISVVSQPLGDFERPKQGWILNDQGVGCLDRLAQTYFLLRDATEGDDRRAGTLRAEAWKRLRMLAFREMRRPTTFPPR